MSISLLDDVEIAESFVTETRELVTRFGRGLSALAQAPADRALVDDLFRAVHTVKGTSGFMGLEQMSALAHHVEDVLDGIRRGRLTVDPRLLDLLRAGLEAMQALLGQVVVEHVEPLDLARLFDALRTASTGRPVEALAAGSLPPASTGPFAQSTGGEGAALFPAADRLPDGAVRAGRVRIESTFRRYDRAARDLGDRLGKQVVVVVEGGETEVDASLAEALRDVLVHLVRNACDHGIEPPDVRAARGKPAAGTIRLAAALEGDHLRLVVEDDGAGLDPDRLRQAAVARALAGEEEAARLSDQEAHTLIFRAGLTTAPSPGPVSGRGVGLDVVADRVARLGGTVAVHTEVGRGARFTILLREARPSLC